LPLVPSRTEGAQLRWTPVGDLDAALVRSDAGLAALPLPDRTTLPQRQFLSRQRRAVSASGFSRASLQLGACFMV
jgi:hypothetical protein